MLHNVAPSAWQSVISGFCGFAFAKCHQLAEKCLRINGVDNNKNNANNSNSNNNTCNNYNGKPHKHAGWPECNNNKKQQQQHKQKSQNCRNTYVKNKWHDKHETDIAAQMWRPCVAQCCCTHVRASVAQAYTACIKTNGNKCNATP